jgi:putative membrane protein
MPSDPPMNAPTPDRPSTGPRPPAGAGPARAPVPEASTPVPPVPPPSTPPWASTPPPTVPPPSRPPPGRSRAPGVAPPARPAPAPGRAAHPTGAGTGVAEGDVSETDEVAEGIGRFGTPRRLHPASVLLGVPIAQLIQALLVPAFAAFAAGGALTVGFLFVIAVVGLIARILSWQRKVFSFDGEVLRVDSGVLSRSHRSLDVARIQQVELQRGPIQRLFGLTALRIETAGSASEPEVDLRVLPEDDALALRAAVRVSKARKTGATPGTDADPLEVHPVLKVPIKHVLLASVTGARLLVLPAVIGGALQFIFQQVGNMLDRATDFLIDQGITRPPEELLNGPDWTLVAVFAAAVVLLTVLAAMVVGVVRDGNFRIERIEDDLHVKRGLISTRESVVPLRRIQLIEVQRNWLRRLLGYTTVRIRSAGGSTGGEGRVSVPLLPASDVDRLLTELLPHVPGIPELRTHPPQALRRALFRWLRPAVLTIAAVWLLPEMIGFLDVPVVERLRWAVFALIPINIVLANVEYRHLAHGLTDRIVVSRRGALSITTTLSPVVKVQAVSSRQNFFQRRLGLTTLAAHVAGPGAVVEVLDAGERDAAALHGHLTEHAASPTHVVPPDHHDLAGPAAGHDPTDDPTDDPPGEPTAPDVSSLASDARAGR